MQLPDKTVAISRSTQSSSGNQKPGVFARGRLLPSTLLKLPLDRQKEDIEVCGLALLDLNTEKVAQTDAFGFIRYNECDASTRRRALEGVVD